MAWQRTALAVTACALGVLRLGLGSSSIAGIVVASLAALTATATFAGARVGYRRVIERLEATRPIGTIGPAGLGTLAVASLGLATLVVLVTA